MPDDQLDLISDIARLRRQTSEEIQELRSRMNAARIEKRGRVGWLFLLRFDPVKIGFVNENLKQQAAVFQDIAAWFRLKTSRTKAYGADVRSAGDAGADVRVDFLLDIKAACEQEIHSEIPELRSLTTTLEELRRSYDEIVGK